jgi:ABC-type transport system involved in cytochrome c biogenesis permease subunit
MAVKWTVQGLLIYLTMAAYLAACVLLVARRRRGGQAAFVTGFAVAVASFGYRWVHAGHVPLQNMFEVFVALGMLAWPIGAFSRRYLAVGGEAGDAAIGLIVLFPAGFIFHAELQKLPPALQSWLFIPHVASYMLAYVILFKAGVQAVGALVRPQGPPAEGLVPYEVAAYRITRLGFPLLTLGLILGCWWGKLAWGNYWNWDPKELWSLVTWVVFLAYLHVRYAFGAKRRRLNAALLVAGCVAIVLTLLWVNLAPRIFPGLHSYAS